MPPYCVEVRKKIGSDGDTDPLGCNGIYQMRTCKEGKIPIKMKFYVPTNPQTIPQQANRSKFNNAVVAWQGLTITQKNVYNERAKCRHFSGYNLYIREYMLS